MMTPRSSPTGASVASRSANSRSTLKLPIRLTLMMRTNFASDLLGVFLALVEHADFRALGGHRARGGGAETGATAGDENGNVFQLHGGTSPWYVSFDGRMASGE